jgi:response regulator of citrate/malate metabolism
MIRTLVVDDDYRVARLHGSSVARVDGFTCVAEAHTAEEARAAIRDLQPDLMLLDIYLPDEDGLSLLRSLHAAQTAPDAIVVTAARDLETVRSAMNIGAVYYLVKPFGFAQLRDQLEAYRRWRQQLASADEADQATVDKLYTTLHRPGASRPDPRRLPPTMRHVLTAVRASPRPLAAADVADTIGISRPTAQRYLSELERRGTVELLLEYGATGRPVHLYRAAGSASR